MQTKDLIAKVRKIEIRTRKAVEDIAGGAYHSMFKGRGIEFSEVRAYSRDDDIRDIDWNVTARTGSPYIKMYMEERELTVLLAVDVSPSVSFGTGTESKRECIAAAAALLAFSAIRNHDKVGLVLFSDRVELYLPPRAGRRQVLRILRELVAREPEPDRRTDLNIPLEWIMRAQKKRAAVFLISDFVDCGNFERNLELLSCRHDVAAFRILDPFEEKLPVRLPPLCLSDAETGAFFCSPARRDIYQKAQQTLRDETGKLLRHARVDLVDLRCGEDTVKPLIGFFRRRRLHRRTGL